MLLLFVGAGKLCWLLLEFSSSLTAAVLSFVSSLICNVNRLGIDCLSLVDIFGTVIVRFEFWRYYTVNEL